MPRQQFLEILIHIIAFMMGAGIGSFLNVVIYRLPNNISVNNPRRSYCPKCKKQIPWYQNIPLFSWLLLRGRCAACGVRIPFRYFFVELLTACLFYAVFLHFQGAWGNISTWGVTVLVFWIFTAFLVAGTFIDIDHYLLPYEITLGGLLCGLLGSWFAPQIMGEIESSRGILFSFVSACIGLGLLWTVVELGKLAFGRIKLRFDKPTAWSLYEHKEGESPTFTAGQETLPWENIFCRASDRIVIDPGQVTLHFNEESERQDKELTVDGVKTEIRYNKVTLTPESGAPQNHDIAHVVKLEGLTRQVVIPREAMGWGDVLLLAMIGSFIGWKGVLFTIVAASFIGTIISVTPRLFGKTEWGKHIPFGPYLAAGAMLWLFYGPQLVDWYLSVMRPQQESLY